MKLVNFDWVSVGYTAAVALMSLLAGMARLHPSRQCSSAALALPWQDKAGYGGTRGGAGGA
jgi:hypothetical protein